MQEASFAKKIKVCHLTSVHAASDTRIFYKECRTLSQSGYEVVLVAPHDKDEVVEGIRVLAVPKAKNRIERMTKTVWQVYRAAVVENADVYHFHDPELILFGIILKLEGKRVIYDVHEDVPKQILTKPWIPSFLRQLIATGALITEKIGALFLDGVIAATPTLGGHFPKNKTAVIQNFPILGEFVNAKAEPYSTRPADIVYVGGITTIRGIREMVEAIHLLPKKLEARLCLAGAFSPAELYSDISSTPGWEKVNFLGWQNRQQVGTLLGHSRIGLVLLHPTRNYFDALPVKLFEYMSAGIPVVASDFPLWTRIIERTKCGLTVNPLDPLAIAKAIEWLLSNPEEAEAMGERGQEAVRNLYNWDHEAKVLIEFYERLIK